MLLVALIVADALNVAADLVAIGSGMQLLHAEPAWLWALRGKGCLTMLWLVLDSLRIALVFKLFCAALLAHLVVAVLLLTGGGSILTHTLEPRIQVDAHEHRVSYGAIAMPDLVKLH